MDFFNALNEVAKNRSNFKKWEDHQRDVDSQRQELHNRRKPSPEEIKAAQELGNRIIDVVDIMDNHSENVAENVETAVDPLSSITTMLTFFGGNYLLGKHSSAKISDKISDIKANAVMTEDAKNLIDKIRAVDPDFYPDYLTSKRRIDRIKDPALKSEARKFLAHVNKEIKPLNAKIWRNHGLMTLGAVGVFILSTIFEAKLQTDSSKIARYQARKELNDPKAFVNYTPEQIAAAEKELKEHPELLKEKKKSRLKSGMIASIYGILRDRSAYLKDKSARSDDSQKVTRPLTRVELVQAQKDKEVIQRTVRVINNEAEKYSENMEVAANVIMNSTPILGATIGVATSWILNKIGVVDKFVDNTVKKYCTDAAKEYLEEYRSIKKPEFFSKKYGKFLDELFMDKNFSLEQPVKKNRFTEEARKILTMGLAHKQGRNWLLGFAGAFVSGIGGMLIALKLQKSSARAGRYTAKRELEKDPKNFIGYSEEDFEEVKDIKNKNKKPSTIKEYITFIPTVLKQYYAYDKFRRTEYKEKQVLNELLRKQNVSDAQMKDAKNLQRKIFNTFEKIDDNSQIYSESMEAATDIAQPFVWYGGLLAASSPLIAAGIQFKRGKLSGAKILDKITDKLSSASNIMQKKWFKKYLGNLEQNISVKLENADVKAKPFGTMFKGINFEHDPLVDISGKILKNTFEGIDDFAKLTKEQQDEKLESLWFSLDRMKDSLLSPLSEDKVKSLMYVVDRIKYDCDMPSKRAQLIKYIVDPASVEDQKLAKKFANLLDGKSKMVTDLFDDLMGIDELAQIAKGTVPDIIKTLKREFDIIDGMNFPLTHKQVDVLKKLFNVSKLNDAGITLYKTEEGELYIHYKDLDKFLDNVAHKLKTLDAKTLIKNFADKKYTDPKTVLSNFKSKIEKMSDEEFKSYVEEKGFSSMDKKTMLNIIPKLEKIIDNVPKEELSKIVSRIIKELSDHPDEFVKMIQGHDVLSFFVTPGMKKALVAAGVSWVGLNILISWAIEQWLADMQLKAGRLGVMKAIESLKDPAYYANIEPTSASKPQNETSIQQSGNLLDKFKH